MWIPQLDFRDRGFQAPTTHQGNADALYLQEPPRAAVSVRNDAPRGTKKKDAREIPGVHVFHVERRSCQRRNGITT